MSQESKEELLYAVEFSKTGVGFYLLQAEKVLHTCTINASITYRSLEAKGGHWRQTLERI